MNEHEQKLMYNEHQTLMKVIFGNEQTGEMGMKAKIDEVHELLIQAKAVGGLFSGVKSMAGWLLVIGAVVALAKGWAIGMLAYLLK